MDWTRSMQQTYSFCSVDPISWKDDKIIDSITSGNIDIDISNDTICSANLVSTEALGEQYIRIYLVATQDRVTERFPLATVLVQTPSSKFNGKVKDISMDGYSSLIELKEKKPPIGYTILKSVDNKYLTATFSTFSDLQNDSQHVFSEGQAVKVDKDETNNGALTYYEYQEDMPHWKRITSSILSAAYNLCSENLRAPVIFTDNNEISTEHFMADISEDYLSFLSAFISKANYRFNLDEYGKVYMEPIPKVSELQPKFTYSDDGLSILQPEITINKDLYGIPNVIEVVYAKANGGYVYSKIVNDDPDSIVSTVSRGREILYRETDPKLPGEPTQEQLDIYAKNKLKSLSTIQGEISYTHGYCPVRVGDAVYINYRRAGINNLRAVVISQSIELKTGCQVSEKAVFTDSLWG